MKYWLAEIILAASSSDEESAFLMQMLALVTLAGLVAVGSIIKTRAKKFKKQRGYYPKRARSRYTQLRWKIKPLKGLKNKYTSLFPRTAQSKLIAKPDLKDWHGADIAGPDQPTGKSADERTLTGGMELLEVGFLVSTVENPKGDDKNDVMMRKLAFNELVRRKQLDRADSNSLKMYAVDEANLYGKHIQCEAMKELAERTLQKRRWRIEEAPLKETKMKEKVMTPQ